MEHTKKPYKYWSGATEKHAYKMAMDHFDPWPAQIYEIYVYTIATEINSFRFLFEHCMLVHVHALHMWRK